MTQAAALLFQDAAEHRAVIERLRALAENAPEFRIDQADPLPELRAMLRNLLTRTATIEAKHKVRAGASIEARRILEALDLLDCQWPPDLAAALPRLETVLREVELQEARPLAERTIRKEGAAIQARREAGEDTRARVLAAWNALKDKAPRNRVSLIRQRTGLSETIIRRILKEAGHLPEKKTAPSEIVRNR